MKTDNYLSLCLEQAAKSPLHYRHGCIVVRGGKVIGQGYNDYRPGFDGGALKTGQLAGGALSGPAMAELKEKLKKQKKPNQQQPQHPSKGSTFTPFEGSGGGHHTNTPLSMHSEMMAIHSALAASSTLSSTAFSQEKPCFKLPCGDKRKARLRADVLKRYVDTVCATAASSGQTQVVHHKNSNNAKEEDNVADRDDEEETRGRSRAQPQWSIVQHVVKECQRAFQAPQSGEKHHHHQKRKEKERKNQKEKERQPGFQYDRYGQQTQLQSQAQRFAPKSKRGKRNDGNDDVRGQEYESMAHEVMKNMSRNACSSAAGSRDDGKQGKSKKDYKRSGKMRAGEPPQPEPMLLPKGHTGLTTADRKKHPRLLGADLYVARLGWNKTRNLPGHASETAAPPAGPPPPPPPDHVSQDVPHSGASGDDSTATLTSSTASLSSTPSSSSGSLHDELLNPSPRPSHPTTATQLNSCALAASCVRESRPCYRCISYMHSVGIKRVFWTNDDGVWEGGKVRDLVDALDNSMESVADGGPMGNGVFVTKHEVLMLKRMMGDGK